MRDMSWMGKKSYQPTFEIGMEVVKPSRKAEGKVKSRVKMECRVHLKDTLSVLCSDIPNPPIVKAKSPAELRAKRKREALDKLRFK